MKQRQFKVLLDENESEYGDTVYYYEVCLCNKGEVLQHFLSLIEAIIVFFVEKGQSVTLKMRVRYMVCPSLQMFVGTWMTYLTSFKRNANL